MVLNDSVPVQTQLKISRDDSDSDDSSQQNDPDSALFFTLNSPNNSDTTPDVYITLSVCSGPEIYLDEDDSGSVDDTFLRLVLSTDTKTRIPKPGSSKVVTVTAYNGFAYHHFGEDSAPDGVFIGVYPPKDPKGRHGHMEIEVTASYVRTPMTMF